MNEELIVISVIIPVYNKKCYIEAMLTDIKNQTFSAFECILVDDGSTDGSEVICDQFVEADSRFRVLHIPNGGVSHARNTGIDQAQGTYITFLDADDRIHPEYLQNLYTCIIQSSADLVISGIQKVWSTANRIENITPPYYGLKTMKDILPTFARVQQETGIFGYCPAKILRKDLISDIRFDESLRLAEDFDFYLKVYARVHLIYFDDKNYYEYLQEAENSTAIVSSEKINYVAQLRVNIRYMDFLTSFNQYFDENRSIINHMINNYFYFSMFYCPISMFCLRFAELSKIQKKEQIRLHGQGILQRWLLLLLNQRQCAAAKATLQCYRALRRFVRRKGV